jgi:acyl-CoA thioesterase
MDDYTEEIQKQSAFVKLLGLSIKKLENGFSQSRLQIREEFLNKRKIVHGGVIYSMVDITMGVAVYSTLKKEEETATIEIKINYLKPVNKMVLVCNATVIQRGKQIAVIEAEVKTEDDHVIAKAIGTFSIIRH